ncbi:uncharacterized protein PSFLO_00162 [Pseudozyma flocculosa]|uniref:Uncharacterized protein n=1 Tax=Pseudozyma flocculosa TaxID=84751 RepID=A0A5C3EUJ5_9BASI|nr:uncharacterized protein PSFLO_00162 [Pseudozyma flocculosa]
MAAVSPKPGQAARPREIPRGSRPAPCAEGDVTGPSQERERASGQLASRLDDVILREADRCWQVTTQPSALADKGAEERGGVGPSILVGSWAPPLNEQPAASGNRGDQIIWKALALAGPEKVHAAQRASRSVRSGRRDQGQRLAITLRALDGLLVAAARPIRGWGSELDLGKCARGQPNQSFDCSTRCSPRQVEDGRLAGNVDEAPGKNPTKRRGTQAAALRFQLNRWLRRRPRRPPTPPPSPQRPCRQQRLAFIQSLVNERPYVVTAISKSLHSATASPANEPPRTSPSPSAGPADEEPLSKLVSSPRGLFKMQTPTL